VRIVVDTTILVRATDKTHGPARDLLLTIVSGAHTLVLSSEILREVARVLRYPRLQKFYGLSEAHVYEFIGYLREVAEIIPLNPLLVLPTRDVTDIMVLQTAVLGEADVLCTRDEDFYTSPASDFLAKTGIAVVDEVYLLRQLRSA
jgi:putative PIN family toxin of toxin-antitoxin system